MQVRFEILMKQSENSAKIWHSRLKGVSVADSDCDEDDWESIWTEGMFRLGKETGGDPLINDYWTKYDDGNCDDDCGDTKSCLAKSSLGIYPWKLF